MGGNIARAQGGGGGHFMMFFRRQRLDDLGGGEGGVRNRKQHAAGLNFHVRCERQENALHPRRADNPRLEHTRIYTECINIESRRGRDGSGQDYPGPGGGVCVPRGLADPRDRALESTGELAERGREVGAGIDQGEHAGGLKHKTRAR